MKFSLLLSLPFLLALFSLSEASKFTNSLKYTREWRIPISCLSPSNPEYTCANCCVDSCKPFFTFAWCKEQCEEVCKKAGRTKRQDDYYDQQ